MPDPRERWDADASCISDPDPPEPPMTDEEIKKVAVGIARLLALPVRPAAPTKGTPAVTEEEPEA